jgi:hypothetical protein
MVTGWPNGTKSRRFKAQPSRLYGPSCCKGGNVVKSFPTDKFNMFQRMRQCNLRHGGRFCVNQFHVRWECIHHGLNPSGSRSRVRGVHRIKTVTVNYFHWSMLQDIHF